MDRTIDFKIPYIFKFHSLWVPHISGEWNVGFWHQKWLVQWTIYYPNGATSFAFGFDYYWEKLKRQIKNNPVEFKKRYEEFCKEIELNKPKELQ